jgi:oligosaccharide repeat unit polymerase
MQTRTNPLVKTERTLLLVRKPPSLSVTIWDWMLLSICLGLVGLIWLGYVPQSSLIAAVLVVLNLVLLASCAFRAMSAGAPGLALMVLSCIIFFWLDAFLLASQSEPYSPPASMPLNENRFSSEEVATALLHCAAFEVMIFVGYSLSVRSTDRAKRWMVSRVDTKDPLKRVLPYLFVPCGFVSLVVGYSFRFDSIRAALLDGRIGVGGIEERGLWVSFDHFGLFAAAYFFLCSASGEKLFRVTYALIGVIAATPFVLSGSRHYLLFIFFPVCLAGLRKLSGSLTPGRLMKWSILFAIFFCLPFLQVTLRSVGWAQLFSPEPIEIYPDASGQFSALLYAEHLVPADHDFFYELAEPYFVFHWIPRQFWQGKPIMAAWEFYNSAYSQGRPFNVTPSIIGQYYMNWGVAGVLIIGLQLGFFARAIDSVSICVQGRHRTAVLVVLGMAYAFLIASFRYYHPLYFTYEAFAIIAMIAVTERIPHQRVRGDRIVSHRFVSQPQVALPTSTR